MSDQFQNHADQVSAPATRAVAVVPHDSNALSDIPKALFVGTGGNITMRGVNGTADSLWKNVPAGTVLPFRARYVRATGTTAADMLALY
ncbi:spike base protein, RCAP_Rcc01079 family [Sphingomonas sp. LT1P40]|uniref:spike base protein, RCAP_Rcc01079 family n=1 Tax=Alteristakelama amylovorans TaxID=3096166 RepID=UPI002FCB6B79